VAKSYLSPAILKHLKAGNECACSAVFETCRCRRRRRTYAPTSNTASHDNHEKINSWVSFSFLYEYGAPLGGPKGRRSSAKKYLLRKIGQTSARK